MEQKNNDIPYGKKETLEDYKRRMAVHRKKMIRQGKNAAIKKARKAARLARKITRRRS